MRAALSVIVFIHALIHIAGFAKAFDIREIAGLSLPLSKPVGVLWLIASILFLLYGILTLLNISQSWIVGIIAVIFSQVLVIIFWQDARLGTIANLFILLACIVSLGSYLVNSSFTEHVKTDLSENNPLTKEILSEKDINKLPLIVQKYLHHTKSVGQPRVMNFKAELQGIMYSGPGDKGMKVESLQYNFYKEPSRYFYMSATKAGLPATGLHIYRDRSATFMVKLLNWFKVIDARGDKLDQAETVTLLNDMCILAPATLIDERITWEEIDSLSVKAIFTNRDITISANLFFEENGELINFISYDRYETDGKEYNNYPWETPLYNYKMIDGYYLPGRGELIYKKPEGDFTYGDLEILSVKYNLDTL